MLPAVIKEPLKKVYFAYLEIKAHRERVKSDRKAQSALIHHEIIKQRDRRAKKIYSTVCFTDEQKKQLMNYILQTMARKFRIYGINDILHILVNLMRATSQSCFIFQNLNIT